MSALTVVSKGLPQVWGVPNLAHITLITFAGGDGITAPRRAPSPSATVATASTGAIGATARVGPKNQ